VSAKEPITPDPGKPAPFDRGPWPGEPGYQPLRPPRGSRKAPPPDPALEEEPLPALDTPQPSAESEPVEEIGYGGEHAEGDLRIPSGHRVIEGLPLGGGRAVAIAVSRFNGQITSGLLESALSELNHLGVSGDSITIMPVPGAFELPLAAMALSKSRRFSCVIALGCVVRGETPHFDFVAGEAASGVLLAGLETGVPVAFGVLTVDNIEQAESRLGKGAEAARSALEMADAFGRLRVIAGG
jgi:6,7-dimethyl-8-ribityllumazine synthase